VIAGVFGGLGRATGTDPVLARVLFGALVVFGVAGHWPVAALVTFLYLAAWLLLPEEGEQTSALEALLGRGQSSVSRTTSALLLVGATIALISLMGGGLGTLLLLGVVGVVAYLAARHSGGAVTATPVPATPASATGPVPAAAPTVEHHEVYTAPFAPHGPYAETQRLPGTPPPPPPVAPPPQVPPRPPKPPRERSALGRLTFSLMLLALGVLGVVAMLGHAVPASAYVAAALGVVALGLLVGSIAGRARGLVFLGILLTIALAITAAAERIDVPGGGDGDVVWKPTTATELVPRYEHRFGNATLDLRSAPIAGTYPARIQLGAGDLTVVLPPHLDATVDAHAGVGQLAILGHDTGGPGSTLRVSDDGPDGPGGGAVDLTIEIGAGNVEVKR
jgi:phage shock protein PspC (stress-responsive transcriptional regulator)